LLAKDSTLRITSRTSVMQYKGAHRPLPEIARSLGVDAILEGSVARSGDKVHMTLQLIQADSDAHLWAESYDRSLTDLSGLPSEAAQQIAKQLQHSVTAAAPVRYVNPEAHDAYLRGRYLWFQGNYPEAKQYFLKATELQPDYAPGWSGLSIYYGASSVNDHGDPRLLLAQQEATARKALQLDPSLPEAHLAMGGALAFVRWDLAGADRELLRAIELDPQFAEAYHFRAKLLGVLNRHPEAIAMEKKAMEINPFERYWALVTAYNVAREWDAAIEDGQLRMKTIRPAWWLFWLLSDSYRGKGMFAESAEYMEKAFAAQGDLHSAAEVRRAFLQGGFRAVVQWELRAAEKEAKTHYLSPLALARLHAQLGQREQTLALLEEAYRQHSPLLLWIQTSPDYDFLHGDPRYRALVQKIGLPPVY